VVVFASLAFNVIICTVFFFVGGAAGDERCSFVKVVAICVACLTLGLAQTC